MLQGFWFRFFVCFAFNDHLSVGQWVFERCSRPVARIDFGGARPQISDPLEPKIWTF